MRVGKPCNHRAGYFPVANKVGTGSTSLTKVDPTRTTSLRLTYGRALTARLNRLKGDLFTLIHEQDVLGKRPLAHTFGTWTHNWTINQTYTYASTQVDIEDPDFLRAIQHAQDLLPPDSVTKLEDTPHITVRYGLHQLEGTPEAVEAIVGGSGDILVTFGQLSIFEIVKDGVPLDVLKVEVYSPDLKELNARLGFLPNTQTYDYNPHMTIAYMKRGTAKEFTGHFIGITGQLAKFTKVYYSDKEGTKMSIPVMYTSNTKWMTKSYVEQVESFQGWLDGKLYDHLLSNDEQLLWSKFTLQAYQRGVLQAFDEMNKTQAGLSLVKQDLNASHQGRRLQFMTDVSRRGVSGGSVGLLASRAFNDIKTVAGAIGGVMVRTFSDGTISQKDSKSIAGQLIRDVESVGTNRLRLVAHTSVVRAYNEGKLDGFESLGIKKVGVDVEWSIKNQRMCTACRDASGVVIPITEARGQLPLHVGCCCAWTMITPKPAV